MTDLFFNHICSKSITKYLWIFAHRSQQGVAGQVDLLGRTLLLEDDQDQRVQENGEDLKGS